MKCKSPWTRILDADKDIGVTLPCGQCIPCLTRRKMQWTGRMLMEQQMWPSGFTTFLTLTLEDDHLPSEGSLKKHDLQCFWKRLRANTGQYIRYFSCGEYGRKTGRAHYHAICWGLPIEQKQSFSDAWKKGFVTVDFATTKRMRYVAKYVTKSQRSPLSLAVLEKVEKGIIEPEFRCMSNRPGLGNGYLPKIAESLCATWKNYPKESWMAPEDMIPDYFGFRYNGKLYPLDQYSIDRIYKLIEGSDAIEEQPIPERTNAPQGHRVYGNLVSIA